MAEFEGKNKPKTTSDAERVQQQIQKFEIRKAEKDAGVKKEHVNKYPKTNSN